MREREGGRMRKKGRERETELEEMRWRKGGGNKGIRRGRKDDDGLISKEVGEGMEIREMLKKTGTWREVNNEEGIKTQQENGGREMV